MTAVLQLYRIAGDAIAPDGAPMTINTHVRALSEESALHIALWKIRIEEGLDQNPTWEEGKITITPEEEECEPS